MSLRRKFANADTGQLTFIALMLLIVAVASIATKGAALFIVLLILFIAACIFGIIALLFISIEYLQRKMR